MSVTMDVYGIKKADDKFYKMKAVYDSCTKANVKIPEEVDDYFGDREPDEKGVVIELNNDQLKEISDYKYEIDLSKFDKDISLLRFELC